MSIWQSTNYIPAWLLRSSVFIWIGWYVAHIVNCSVIGGTVPSYWLNALVTPAPKVPKPTDFSDFRPISVTPLISRLSEKNHCLKVDITICSTRHVTRPCFQTCGSTSAALTYFMHQVTRLLEENNNMSYACWLILVKHLMKFTILSWYRNSKPYTCLRMS